MEIKGKLFHCDQVGKSLTFKLIGLWFNPRYRHIHSGFDAKKCAYLSKVWILGKKCANSEANKCEYVSK